MLNNGFFPDVDRDGFGDAKANGAACDPSWLTIPGDDCDDTRADVYPGALERCDDVDNDCDGRIDNDLFPDADRDGFGDENANNADCEPSWLPVQGSDCNDTRADVYPYAP